MNTLMSPDHFPVGPDDVARNRLRRAELADLNQRLIEYWKTVFAHAPFAVLFKITIDETRVIAVRNETDFLAFRLLRGGQSGGGGDCARFFLGHFAQGEHRVTQLLLRQLEEEIRLILRAVDGAQQQPA